MRTGTNPAALDRSARPRLPITPLRTNARLIQVHWCMLICLSRQYCEKLTPSCFASSKWARHARSRSLRISRFRWVIVLSRSAATVPRWKASPVQLTAESTGMPECLQILSLTLREQMPLDELLAQIDTDQNPSESHNQMNLFD